VWRLETSTGTWAVKELFHREPEVDTRLSAEFQETAVRAGVPAPAVVRTADGACCSTWMEGSSVSSHG